MPQINTIETAIIFQNTLDALAIQEGVTGWMDANAGQVIYNGGAEVKVPMLSTQGMGEYDRSAGYVEGSIDFHYQTLTMTQDRGRKFTLDAMDVDETNFVLNGSKVMGTFQTEQVTPEIDAYRLAKLAAMAILKGNVKYGYTPAAATILEEIKNGILAIRKKGYRGELVVHLNDDCAFALEMFGAGKLTSVTFSQGGIDTQVPAIDRVPLIATPQDRLYTAIQLYDGKTAGQEAGGYVKGATAKDVNFIVVAKIAPIAVTKQDIMRIFTPEQYQDANAWSLDYRRFHELWTMENKQKLIYVNIKDAAV